MKSGVFVGLSTVDVVYGVERFPTANSKVVARSQDVFVGGPAANASITFAHLGGGTTLVTAVGRHPLAGLIRAELRNYSVRLIDLNPDFDEVPIISSISVDQVGDRNIVSANAGRVPAVAAYVVKGVCDGASVLLVDGHHMEACQAWAEAASARGVPVVMDAGSWKTGTEHLLEIIDTAICSADFLPPGCSTDDDVLKYLEGCGVKNIAITRGAESIRFVSSAVSGMLPVENAHVVDTMGAGDILHGAFCYYVAVGWGFLEALEEAKMIATESCRYPGPREWMNHYIARRSPRRS